MHIFVLNKFAKGVEYMENLKTGSYGPQVMLVQSILKTLGFYTGEIDGVFGLNTQRAVRRFQRNFLLESDGVVGKMTWNLLMPYINGYRRYTIKRGDTFYNIARRFATTNARISVANPNVSPTRLFPGQSIIVPFGNVVKTNISYTYDIFSRNIESLKTIYPFLNVTSIGKSVLGKELTCIRLGNGLNEVFYSGSIHANEWITSVVLMKFIENFCRAYVNNTKLYGFDVREVFSNSSIYIVPMVNPDGVDLVTGGMDTSLEAYQNAKIIAENYPAIPFPDGWKANIDGVDLNLQFPAGWENARQIKFAQGFTTPAPRDYVGNGPLTQPEAISMYDFTLAHDFRLILAYHTQGRVIYWRFLDYLPPQSREIGEKFADISGYLLESTPYSSGYAGYKDWFIQNYNRPGYTIEVGWGSNPLPISQFNTIYSENEGILITGAVI